MKTFLFYLFIFSFFGGGGVFHFNKKMIITKIKEKNTEKNYRNKRVFLLLIHVLEIAIANVVS